MSEIVYGAAGHPAARATPADGAPGIASTAEAIKAEIANLATICK